jgi:hypothetical protein
LSFKPARQGKNIKVPQWEYITFSNVENLAKIQQKHYVFPGCSPVISHLPTWDIGLGLWDQGSGMVVTVTMHTLMKHLYENELAIRGHNMGHVEILGLPQHKCTYELRSLPCRNLIGEPVVDLETPMFKLMVTSAPVLPS